ncbi:saccharopine dehydrogenase [Thecamonas trahens ATCC 50062]|uniref:Saccharopine dehydrogenase n=1 Tax=Thecamonas trahens ATCC 50062 TaxID=461836 RepID=A0A0L0D632_THETB|nr:saccharopine dehydrogenase [Thecamonas trahens ATCC 50062]KNC47536.1 saccharopine dehydrogenase [Thecamonas trahens ATCC 50062]|eukprot:XP_013759468.1 saccharopine dehydrogenase [Thecamonas trahens ATCC 50062]
MLHLRNVLQLTRGYAAPVRGLAAAVAARSTVSELRAKLVESERKMASLKHAMALHPDPARKRVAVLGAGRSSGPLIRYLLERAEDERWSVLVADANVKLAASKAGDHPAAAAVELDVANKDGLTAILDTADVVVSMLPASMHAPVIEMAIGLGKPVVTASYATPDVRQHDAAAKAAGVPIVMECGVDPGIDHMSAKALIDGIRDAGGDVREFRSYTGGLVAPESTTDNPWKYKLSWNPRNVVLAGRGVSTYLQAGVVKFIPYNKLFSRAKNVVFPDGTTFEAYANRDSLQYIDAYDLASASTVLRGTLRWPGFCEAWDVFVQLGLTDDSFAMEDADRMTYAEFLASFLPWRQSDSVELLLAYQLQQPMFSAVMDKIRWLGLFSDRRINAKGSPARILELLLQHKWRLRPGDRDLIGMLHKIAYVDANGEAREKISALKIKGSATDPDMTAMATTVSLPVAIMTKRILNGETFGPGVVIPTERNIYKPILAELADDFGISFEDSDIPLVGGIHSDHFPTLVSQPEPSAAIEGSL